MRFLNVKKRGGCYHDPAAKSSEKRKTPGPDRSGPGSVP